MSHSVVVFLNGVKTHSKENKTNPLWPSAIGKEKAFPIAEFDSKNFEVIGNLYEGKKK